jgi:hypothetical protein
MTVGTQRRYAEHRGCSEAYISKKKREGQIVFTADGLVDFDATDRLLGVSADPDKEGVRERWRREKAAQSHGAGATMAGVDQAGATGRDARARGGEQPDDFPDSSGQDGAPPAGSGNPLYDERLEVQIRTLRLDEQRKQLELARYAGTLILAVDAEERQHAYGREVRDAFLALPARLAADLAADTDPQSVARRLNDEIKAALHELTRRVAAEPAAAREAGESAPT